MNQAQRAELAGGYDATIRRIKSWLLIAAGTAPLAFVAWKVVVPHLPPSLRDEGVFISVTVLGLAGYAVFVSLILWMLVAREKRQRVGDEG